MTPIRVRFFALLLAVLILVTSGALGNDRIIFAGSTTVKPVVEQGVAMFRKLHPQVDAVVGAGGSGQGILLVGTNAVNIGMISRPLEAHEREQFPDLVTYTIGVDGVAIVANQANPVRKLSTQQIQNIYTGKITNWKEVGGSNGEIVRITLNHNHGTSEVFANYFGLETKENGVGINLKATFRKKGETQYSSSTAAVIEDHRQVLAQIITTPNAIGYVSIGQAMQVVQSGAHIRLLQLDDVEPTVANVQSGAYQFSRPLMLVTKGEAQGHIRDLIDFFCGPEGQAIVSKLDYIPVVSKQ
jgi:phosphate transport system substrate-binding protein